MVGACNLHLRSLNPHIEYVGYPALFVDEHTDCAVRCGISGVSSFGVGGTNARGDLWGRCTLGYLATKEVYTLEKQKLQSTIFSRALNDEGALVAPGSDWGHKHLVYCGRPLPDGGGRCGPAGGPQCEACARYSARQAGAAAALGEGE
eukprot:SRR837773.817.p2 GENE.SRR837773.817~~SRR837773.817.p2  ORF type:complete len:164 (+),score=39.67 SRR837773.817:49-492(+)